MTTMTAPEATVIDLEPKPAPELGILTKPILAALRSCDRVCFFADYDKGTSYLRAIRENPAHKKNPLEPAQFDVEFDLAKARWHGDWISGNERTSLVGRKAFLHLSSYKHSDIGTTYTTLHSLRVGDQLRMQLWCGNGSGYLDGATTQAEIARGQRLYRDDCTLIVRRPIKKGAAYKTLVFHLDTSVCPDNSARMCRR